MVPLLAALFDFESTPEVYERYDRMSARELFQRYALVACLQARACSTCHSRVSRRHGVSTALYREFLRPLLLVGMFAEPEELSAATMLETFSFCACAACLRAGRPLCSLT